ncbi:PHD zinc finger-containing protein, partial [Reticulomyxa filosa]
NVDFIQQKKKLIKTNFIFKNYKFLFFKGKHLFNLSYFYNFFFVIQQKCRCCETYSSLSKYCIATFQFLLRIALNGLIICVIIKKEKELVSKKILQKLLMLVEESQVISKDDHSNHIVIHLFDFLYAPERWSLGLCCKEFHEIIQPMWKDVVIPPDFEINDKTLKPIISYCKKIETLTMLFEKDEKEERNEKKLQERLFKRMKMAQQLERSNESNDKQQEQEKEETEKEKEKDNEKDNEREKPTRRHTFPQKH